MIETPVCRHFVVCNDITVTNDRNEATLVEVYQAIALKNGESYPAIRRQICFYAVFTNARGTNTLQIELTTGVEGSEQTHFRSRALTLELGNDPLRIYGLPIRLKNIVFENPGQYEFRLTCNGEVIAREYIEMRA